MCSDRVLCVVLRCVALSSDSEFYSQRVETRCVQCDRRGEGERRSLRCNHLEKRSSETMRPYRPSTSAKIRMRIMPTNRRGCCAAPRTPASPTMPIAKPAARPDRPTLRPAPSCPKFLHKTREFLCVISCTLSPMYREMRFLRYDFYV